MSKSEDKKPGNLDVTINYTDVAQDIKTLKFLMMRRADIDREIYSIHQRISDRLEKAALEKNIDRIERRLVPGERRKTMERRKSEGG